MTKQSRFNIDFFEFSFLVEACIPPRPIARMYFWNNVINVYYHELTKNERAKLFKWINKNPNFNIENKDCKLFYDRFNPDNQYKIFHTYKRKKDSTDCFLHNDRYYTSKDSWVASEFITKVEKI